MNPESLPARSPLFMTRIASFVAVGLVAGIALAAVPNVELVTAVCFCAGFLLGAAAGVITGGLTEALFAGFNPLGSSLGFLLVAQVVGMAAAGLLGAFTRRLTGDKTGFLFSAIVVSMGALITLFFDLITNLAYPLAAGFSVSQTMVTLVMGVPFAVIHIGSNAVVFALLVVPLLPKLKKVLAVS